MIVKTIKGDEDYLKEEKYIRNCVVTDSLLSSQKTNEGYVTCVILSYEDENGGLGRIHFNFEDILYLLDTLGISCYESIVGTFFKGLSPNSTLVPHYIEGILKNDKWLKTR